MWCLIQQMFTQTFVDGTEKTKKPLTLMLSLFLQVSALIVLILIPLIYTQTLPGAQLKNLLVAPGPPPAAIPKQPVSTTASTKGVRRLYMQRLVAPVVIPNKINSVTEAPVAPDVGVFGSNGVADSGKDINGIIGSMPDVTPPAVPAAPKKTANGPVRNQQRRLRSKLDSQSSTRLSAACPDRADTGHSGVPGRDQ